MSVPRVSLIEHWLVLDPHPDAETFVVWDAEAADEYRRARGYRVDGPFVTADQLTGAVEALQHARSVMVRSRHRNDATMMDALRQVEAALAWSTSPPGGE